MPWKQILVAVMFVMMTQVCFAQPADTPAENKGAVSTPGDDAAPAEGDVEAAAEPEEEKKMELEGDVVIFKNGSELRGVKVIRESAMFVEIEYLPGEPALKIPTTQVSQVVYETKTDAAPGAAPDELVSMPEIMPGKEVSVEFHHVLMTVLSEEPLVYEEADYLKVVQELAEKAGATIDVEEGLSALPEQERRFTRTVPAGTTLLAFFQKEFPEIAPDVRVILLFDKLALQKREAAPVEGVSEAPVPAPEPAPEPASVPAPAPAPVPAPAPAAQ